jgi:alkylhydroperoxidase family enzyme
LAHIRLVEPHEATGVLRSEYDAALKRAGRVWNIVKTMSPNPAVLVGSMHLYTAAMKGPSPLSRAQRELLAVVVSSTNDCFY